MYIKLSENPKTRFIDVLWRGEVIVEITETGEIVGVDIRKPVLFPKIEEAIVVKELVGLEKLYNSERLVVQSGDTLPQNKE